MTCGIADNAFFHGTYASLELWLDQRDELGGHFEKRCCGRQSRLERNKANINGQEIRPFVELGGGQVANVSGLERNNLSPGTQCLVQLPSPNINGVNTPGAAIQKYMGKSTCRGTDIEADVLSRI